ncbi:unnamed protein product [Urochloa decumbens]
MPVIGAAIADSYWGKYKTVLVGLSISLAGMLVVTTSATLPSLRPPPCEHAGAHCAPATPIQRLLFFAGIYLCAVGTGGAKAAIVSFGAEQFDDGNAAERERKASYFSWFYGVANLAVLISGTLLVWVEEDLSWGLGYGVCAALVAAAVAGLAATAHVYRIVPPAGSPLKGACQVLVALAHKVRVRVPEDASELYEEEVHVIKTPLLLERPAREQLGHTNQFRWLDKAAVVVTGADMEAEGASSSPWRLCTVTQVEEFKTLLRLIPIWATSAVYFVANAQTQTTFVQQGAMTDTRIAIAGGALSFSVPAASMTSVMTVLEVAYLALYNLFFLGRKRRAKQALTPLQLMGLGHGAAAGAVALAALAEARRLAIAAEAGAGAAPMGIAWLLPQYAAMAVSDASLAVGQLEFFYGEAPETMRAASTAFYFLSCSVGNLLSSQLVTLVASVTAAGGRKGWFPPDMDEGHLDYYFLLVVGIAALNFAVFVYLAKNYTPKRVR